MFLLKFMILLNIQCLRLIILSSLIICVLGSNFVTRQSRKASVHEQERLKHVQRQVIFYKFLNASIT
ncbi:hypothetical protein EB796_022194 [Bugula neritina]|uniref:Uncharacterized protein n=1 Tax=Bugula neritina TaxID=10212 RepID=A0A7J7IZZ3_BUGNE|nr:hypothetical protein EB796_022194 [Bugula neritina]